MTWHVRRWLVVPMILGLVLVTTSCSGDDDGGVGVTLADFTITADPDSASAGEVTFDVTNDAEQTHEFVVFQTDLAADQLPTGEGGDVDEAGEGVELVDEIEDIEGGSTQSLDGEPGRRQLRPHLQPARTLRAGDVHRLHRELADPRTASPRATPARETGWHAVLADDDSSVLPVAVGRC